MKRWLILIGAVVAIVLVIGIIKALQVKTLIDGFAAMPEVEAAVSTQKAELLDWNTELSAVGSLRAVRGVDLSTEVAGIVQNASFLSGQEVKEGQVLVQLNADADLARLNSMQAMADLANTNLKRDQLQVDAEAISRSQFDTSASNLKSAHAQVAEQAALVAKKTIRAPFSGRLGISAVNRGLYLNAGDKIVTLQQLDPIYVDFRLPQQALSQLAVGQKVSALSDSFPDKGFEGEISAIDPIVDTDTRNVRVQATLGNPQRKLLPGMFSNVKVAVGAPRRLLTVPQTAVAFNPYGETVFVIVKRGEENAADPNLPANLATTQALSKIDAEHKAAADAKGKKPKDAEKAKSETPAAKPVDPAAPPVLVAREVFVTTGPTRGDQVAIISGLKEGDEVVTSGQLKLKNGTRVSVNNTVVPTYDRNPKPEED